MFSSFPPPVVFPCAKCFLVVGEGATEDPPEQLAAADIPQLSAEDKVNEWMELEGVSRGESPDVAGPDPDLPDPSAVDLTINDDGNKIVRVSGGAPITSEASALDVDQCDASF